MNPFRDGAPYPGNYFGAHAYKGRCGVIARLFACATRGILPPRALTGANWIIIWCFALQCCFFLPFFNRVSLLCDGWRRRVLTARAC